MKKIQLVQQSLVPHRHALKLIYRGSDVSASSLRVGELVNDKDGDDEDYKPPPKKSPNPNLVKKPLALVDVSNTPRKRNETHQPLRVGGHEEYKVLSLVDVIQHQPGCCSNRKERKKDRSTSMA